MASLKVRIRVFCNQKLKQRKIILFIISYDRKEFGVMISPSSEGKIRSPKQKCQILNTTGARRFRISRKCHWLDNMCLTGLTLDKSTSISSKINKEMREEQRGGSFWIITGKRREIWSPWWKRSKLARRSSKILQRQLKNLELMDLLREKE